MSGHARGVYAYGCFNVVVSPASSLGQLLQLGCWFETELLDVSIHSGLWVGRSDHGFHERSHVLGDSRTRVSSDR